MSNLRKFIDFIITQKCTYNCSYCSQAKCMNKNPKEADNDVIKAFLEFISKLDKDFEITITGGEAILHSKFMNLIYEIKKMGFKINLISNLSFEIKTYVEIFDLLKENLNNFDLSFHLDEIKDFDYTLAKLDQFINFKPKYVSMNIFIPIFKLNDEKIAKINKIEKLAKQYDIPFYYQQIRYFGKKQKVSSLEQEYFKEYKTIKSFSRQCFAGCKSAIIYENGDVYRCYSSRVMKNYYLGNIKDKKFALSSDKSPCLMKNCSCPKFNDYGQIANDKADILQLFPLVAYNCINLPTLVVDNFDKIYNKILQKFKNKI